MKLWDYACDTCGRREERWDDPPAVVPCSSKACSGSMTKVLGGRPATSTGQKPAATRNEKWVPAIVFGYARVPVKDSRKGN
jgi:hypothetical protein